MAATPRRPWIRRPRWGRSRTRRRRPPDRRDARGRSTPASRRRRQVRRRLGPAVAGPAGTRSGDRTSRPAPHRRRGMSRAVPGRCRWPRRRPGRCWMVRRATERPPARPAERPPPRPPAADPRRRSRSAARRPGDDLGRVGAGGDVGRPGRRAARLFEIGDQRSGQGDVQVHRTGLAGAAPGRRGDQPGHLEPPPVGVARPRSGLVADADLAANVPGEQTRLVRGLIRAGEGRDRGPVGGDGDQREVGCARPRARPGADLPPPYPRS